MKSIGEHLKTAREEKGFSFDQVVHDTNISREYIYALEGDDFDFFPAEAYLIGFLRNYSEYLGLEPAKMVGIYKNFKISEEPVPMDLLLGKKMAPPEKKESEIEPPKGGFPRILIPVIVLVVLLGAAAFFFIPSWLRGNGDEPVTEEAVQSSEASTGPKEFFLTEDTLDITVSSGDSINVSTGSKVMSFDVVIGDQDKKLNFMDREGAANTLALQEGNEQVVLIDDKVGVYFFIKKVSARSVLLIAQKVTLNEGENRSEGQTAAGEAAVPENQTTTAAPERIADKIVIMTETYPKAYEIDALYRGDTLFRYEADGQGRVERFFQAGERLKIDVSRSVILWASSAGYVDIKISGQEVSIGESGQVVVRSVKWVKNNDTGKYELVIIPYN